MLKHFANHPLRTGSWKDFFIPHPGNGHKPKALHPKRVLFHITSALIIKAILLVFVFNYPLLAWMSPDVAAGEGQKIISQTNQLRASLSVPSLTENGKLDIAAALKVQDMFINQYFAHTSPSGLGLKYWLAQAGYSGYQTAGENLAVGFNSATDVMAAWKNSPSHYSNLVDPDFKEVGVGLSGGTYTNIETIFIAQYFGQPAASSHTIATAASTPTPKPAIAVDTSKTKVTVSKPAGSTTTKIVKVAAVLPPEVKTASATVLNKSIPLAPTELGQWQGQDVVTQPKEYAVVPASLTVTDTAGETISTDIGTANIVPEKQSLLDQYWLYRTHPNHWLSKIFDISTIYFKIILLVAMIALLLNILIVPRIQYPRLIFSGTALIVCMLILIIF